MNSSRRSPRENQGHSCNTGRSCNDSTKCCRTDGDVELERRRKLNRHAQRKYRSNMQQRFQELDQIKSVLGIGDATNNLTPATVPPYQEQAWPTLPMLTTMTPQQHDLARPQLLLQQQSEPSPAIFSDHSMAFDLQNVEPPSMSVTTDQPLLPLSMRKGSIGTSEGRSDGSGPEQQLSPSLRSTLGWDVTTPASNTPLHLAASQPDVQTVRMLLRYGATVNSVNTHGDTPLHVAAAKGHLDVVSCLLEAGANVRARNIFDLTAMHAAVLRGHTNVVNRLCQSGADPNDVINVNSPAA